MADTASRAFGCSRAFGLTHMPAAWLACLFFAQRGRACGVDPTACVEQHSPRLPRAVMGRARHGLRAMGMGERLREGKTGDVVVCGYPPGKAVGHWRCDCITTALCQRLGPAQFVAGSVRPLVVGIRLPPLPALSLTRAVVHAVGSSPSSLDVALATGRRPAVSLVRASSRVVRCVCDVAWGRGPGQGPPRRCIGAARGQRPGR